MKTEEQYDEIEEADLEALKSRPRTTDRSVDARAILEAHQANKLRVHDIDDGARTEQTNLKFTKKRKRLLLTDADLRGAKLGMRRGEYSMTKYIEYCVDKAEGRRND